MRIDFGFWMGRLGEEKRIFADPLLLVSGFFVVVWGVFVILGVFERHSIFIARQHGFSSRLSIIWPKKKPLPRDREEAISS